MMNSRRPPMQRAPEPPPVAGGSRTAPGLYNTPSLSRIRNMNNKSHVDTMELFRGSQASESVLIARSRTIRRVENVIQSRYGRQYRIELFGSSAYGVDSATSDLDMVVIVPEHPIGFEPRVRIQDLPPIYNVRALGALLKRNGFREVLAIPTASVPIVKFVDPETGIACDLNVNDQLGCHNTRLIKRYCDISPILRPVLTSIKQWAKPLGLNNPSGSGGPSTFSSYCLTMMTIGLFQKWDLLPNLQANISNSNNYRIRGNIFWLRGKTERPRIRCDARFEEMSSWRSEKEMTVEAALIQWFRYWADEHRYKVDKMSIREGGVVPRVHQLKSSKRNELGENAGPSISEDINEVHSSTGPVHSSRSDAEPITWRTNSMVIADPFILTKNLASSVPKSQITRFREACRAAVGALDGTSDLVSALSPVPVTPTTQPKQSRRNRTRTKKVNQGASTTAQNAGGQTFTSEPAQALVEEVTSPHQPSKDQPAVSTAAATNYTATSPSAPTSTKASKSKQEEAHGPHLRPSGAKRRKERRRRAAVTGANPRPTHTPTSNTIMA